MSPKKAILILFLAALVMGGAFIFLYILQHPNAVTTGGKSSAPKNNTVQLDNFNASAAPPVKSIEEQMAENKIVVNGKEVPIDGSTTISKVQSIIEHLSDPEPALTNNDAREVLLKILNDQKINPQTTGTAQKNAAERDRLLTELNK